MSKLFALSLILLSISAIAAQSIPVKDNSDIAISLSQNNYNRLTIKGDKILEAHFPPAAMAMQRDAQDGSVYVMLANAAPVTVFLTTEAGRHYAVTLSGEESLGKTIELVPKQIVAAQVKPTTANKAIVTPTIPNAVVSLIAHMEQGQALAGTKISRQFGKAKRWSQGITLIPKQVWQGSNLKGEIIEIYNGGQMPLKLSASWFSEPNVKALKFSQDVIAPKEHALLYRVQGTQHG